MTATFTLDTTSVTLQEDIKTEAKPDSQAPDLLKDIVAAICFDARRDSLRYALRSNVGHDGE